MRPAFAAGDDYGRTPATWRTSTTRPTIGRPEQRRASRSAPPPSLRAHTQRGSTARKQVRARSRAAGASSGLAARARSRWAVPARREPPGPPPVRSVARAEGRSDATAGIGPGGRLPLSHRRRPPQIRTGRRSPRRASRQRTTYVDAPSAIPEFQLAPLRCSVRLENRLVYATGSVRVSGRSASSRCSSACSAPRPSSPDRSRSASSCMLIPRKTARSRSSRSSCRFASA